MANIVMVLDQSGSMGNIRNDIIGSVNTFIDGQRNNGSTFTLITFSDCINTIINKVPINKVSHIGQESYYPTGSTALFKAIIDTIKKFENEENVLMVIVTDGQENASPKEYTRKKVFDLVTSHADKNGWKFIYLSADIDTFTQGANLGFGTNQNMSNMTGCCNTAVGYSSLAKNISSACNIAVSNYATSASSSRTTK
jgi:Mg-chelatase subunit ChlD